MICTVTPISNSKQVENYYTRDDYYSRDAKHNDFWQGNLADKFDLNHQAVHKNHFAALIQLTNERSNFGNKKPTLGVDITFSCPKSVSILQAVSPEYRKIVNRCLAETTDELISLIEQKFIRTRRNHEGKILEYTKNILAASVNHEVNRNDELDRHTHIFIPNMTLTDDGKLLTIDIKFLMQQQKLFGAIARSKLASKLQREGIELENSQQAVISKISHQNKSDEPLSFSDRLDLNIFLTVAATLIICIALIVFGWHFWDIPSQTQAVNDYIYTKVISETATQISP